MNNFNDHNGLDHVLSVRLGNKQPNYKKVKSTRFPADKTATWGLHDAYLQEVKADDSVLPSEDRSLLDMKIALVNESMRACTHCPHACGIDRLAGETGFCGVAAETAVHWEGVLFAEEHEIVPSYEVFTSGCTMRCAFCYSHEQILSPMIGNIMAPLELAKMATDRIKSGAVSLNMVGGDPTVHLYNFLKMLIHLDVSVPVVWNSNMYASGLVMQALDGIIDLYLGDIHFGNHECAAKLGRIPRYLDTVKRNFEIAATRDADVVVRHLVMPGHVECCAIPAMEWAVQKLPNVPFHLMFQYLPDYRALTLPEMNRAISADEKNRATDAAHRLGIKLYVGNPKGERSEHVNLHANRNGADMLLGDTVNVIVQPDGQVVFHRLVEELIPVANALATDQRSC